MLPHASNLTPVPLLASLPSGPLVKSPWGCTQGLGPPHPTMLCDKPDPRIRRPSL